MGDTVPSIKTVSYTDIYGRLIADGAVVGDAEWLNRYTYDSFGNKIQELTANDSYNNRSFTNKYTYDVKGNVTSVCNALNQYTYKTYDWLGNVLTETDLAGNVTTYTYDAFGRVLTKTVPVDEDRSQLVTNTYDANGNLTSENISEKTNSSTFLIKSTEYTYNNRNNLTSVKTYGLISSSPLSATTYTYDAKGQVLTSTTGEYTTSYTYDGRGNVLSTTYPGGGIETFTYNAANNVITSTDRKGVTTTYTYNLFGKPTAITAGGKSKNYTYASNGSILTETSEAGTISYTYDDLGRKSSETTGGKTTNYTYDRAGNILTVSQLYITTYEYDALNRVVKAYTVHSSANYTYNEAGQRASMSVRSHINEISRTTYTYNYAGAITSLINSTPDGEMLSQFTYTYDVLGNVLTSYDSTTDQTASYAYDALGRLISEIKGGNSRYYTYDAAGNRTKAIVDTANTIVYTYDSDGRLISETLNNGQTSTTTSYAYDANGNLASKTANNVTTTYTFDAWGNMTSANGATYTYNVQGLRIAKTVGSKTANFTLVGGKVVSDGASNYFWATELVTNGSVYYLYNAHGDVVQVLNSSGEVTKTYNYDAYGNELTRDLNDSNPFRYCGEYYDTETGFIYLRARYYNPNTGRFISVDPIHDGTNWYAYCGNNPISYADPWGLRPKDLTPQATAVCLDGGGSVTPAKMPSTVTSVKMPTKTSLNIVKETDLSDEYANKIDLVDTINNQNNSYDNVNGTSPWNVDSSGLSSKIGQPFIKNNVHNFNTTTDYTSWIQQFKKGKGHEDRRPNEGEPGSTYTTVDGDLRIYGPDGKPQHDYDHDDHNDKKGTHPKDENGGHWHDWVDGKRGKPYVIIEGIALIVIGTIGVAVIIMDDATVVGVADDGLLAPLLELLREGISLLA